MAEAPERASLLPTQVAAVTGTNRRTAYNWIAEGKVEFFTTGPRSCRIYVDSIWRKPDGSKYSASDPENDLTKRKLVSIGRAQTILGVSRRTIYNKLNAGKFVYLRTPGGSIRIATSSFWVDPPNPDEQRNEATKNDKHVRA